MPIGGSKVRKNRQKIDNQFAELPTQASDEGEIIKGSMNLKKHKAQPSIEL